MRKSIVWLSVVVFGLLLSAEARLKSMVEENLPVETGKNISSGPGQTAEGVEFLYFGEAATSVSVAGTFNNWQAGKDNLVKGKDGLWRIVLPLKPGTYQYKFVVDGNWVADSNNPETTDDGYGGKNSVVVVKESPAKIVKESAKTTYPVNTKDGVRFIYKGKAESVYLAGSFNDWNPQGLPLKKVKEDEWQLVYKLPVGSYQYKFVVDGNWIADSNNSETTDDGYGGKNSVVEVKPLPGVGPKKTARGVEFNYDNPNATSVSIAGTFNNWQVGKDNFVKGKDGLWRIVLPLKAGTYQYKFVVDGNWIADSNNSETTDDGYGGKNSVITVK